MKRNVVFFIWTIAVISTVSGQSALDWVLDPVGTATDMVIGAAADAASSAWEGFLSDQIKSSLSEDASKIARYKIDSTKLESIDAKYDQHSYGVQHYSDAINNLNEAMLSYIYVTPKGNISAFGNDNVGKYLSNEVQKANAQVAKRKNRIDLFMSNHPELRELQKRWKGQKGLYDNPQQLYYWGLLADKVQMPTKYDMPKAEMLTMRSSAEDKYSIKLNGTEIGTVKLAPTVFQKCTVNVKDIDLINFHGMPNAVYQVENCTYETDAVGRVVKVNQMICMDEARKSVLNKKGLKEKHFVSEKGQMSYAYADLKYNGTISRMNIISINKTKDNKKTLKQRKKLLSKYKKMPSPVPIETQITYTGLSDEIEKIGIQISTDTLFLTND